MSRGDSLGPHEIKQSAEGTLDLQNLDETKACEQLEDAAKKYSILHTIKLLGIPFTLNVIKKLQTLFLKHQSTLKHLEFVNGGLTDKNQSFLMSVLKNNEVSLKYLNLSQNKISAGGYSFLGECFEQGIGVEINPLKAIENYVRATSGGFVPAELNLAKILSRDSHHKFGEEMRRTLDTKRGSSAIVVKIIDGKFQSATEIPSMPEISLGVSLKKSHIVDSKNLKACEKLLMQRDFSRALSFMEKHEETIPQIMFGIAYLAKRDFINAKKYLEAACRSGQYGQYYLALIHFKQNNYTMALTRLAEAATLNIQDAQNLLMKCYEGYHSSLPNLTGSGSFPLRAFLLPKKGKIEFLIHVKRNLLEPALLQLAVEAQKNHSGSRYQIEWLAQNPKHNPILLRDLGIVYLCAFKNFELAMKCFIFAKDSGDLIAKYYIALLLLTGKGIVKSEPEAIRIFQAIIENGVKPHRFDSFKIGDEEFHFPEELLKAQQIYLDMAEFHQVVEGVFDEAQCQLSILKLANLSFRGDLSAKKVIDAIYMAAKFSLNEPIREDNIQVEFALQADTQITLSVSNKVIVKALREILRAACEKNEAALFELNRIFEDINNPSLLHNLGCVFSKEHRNTSLADFYWGKAKQRRADNFFTQHPATSDKYTILDRALELAHIFEPSVFVNSLMAIYSESVLPRATNALGLQKKKIFLILFSFRVLLPLFIDTKNPALLVFDFSAENDYEDKDKLTLPKPRVCLFSLRSTSGSNDLKEKESTKEKVNALKKYLTSQNLIDGQLHFFEMTLTAGLAKGDEQLIGYLSSYLIQTWAVPTTWEGISKPISLSGFKQKLLDARKIEKEYPLEQTLTTTSQCGFT